MDTHNILIVPWISLDEETVNECLCDYFSYISKDKLKYFVYNVFRKVARNLKTPYDSIKDILFDQNVFFFAELENTFDENVEYNTKESEKDIKYLLYLIKIPDISKITQN